MSLSAEMQSTLDRYPDGGVPMEIRAWVDQVKELEKKLLEVFQPDLYAEWQYRLWHVESLPKDTDTTGAILNEVYARGEWEKAVLAAAQKVMDKDKEDKNG